MAGTTTRNSLDIAEELAELKAEVLGLKSQAVTGLTIHEFTGDTSETDFALPKGFKPVVVFENGSLVREGSGEDYTVSFDGFVRTVVFASAPAAVDVTILAERA